MSVQSLVCQIRSPVCFVEGDDGAFRAAGGEENLIAVHQRRLREAPFHERPAEVGGEMFAPDFLAVFGVHADDLAILTQGKDEAAIHGGRGARAGEATPARRAGFAELGGPKDLAVGAVEGKHVVGVGLVTHGEDALAGDRHAGETGAEAGGFPEERGAVFGPLLQQACFGGKAVAVRTAPLRPVRRGSEHGMTEEGPARQ